MKKNSIRPGGKERKKNNRVRFPNVHWDEILQSAFIMLVHLVFKDIIFSTSIFPCQFLSMLYIVFLRSYLVPHDYHDFDSPRMKWKGVFFLLRNEKRKRKKKKKKKKPTVFVDNIHAYYDLLTIFDLVSLSFLT